MIHNSRTPLIVISVSFRASCMKKISQAVTLRSFELLLMHQRKSVTRIRTSAPDVKHLNDNSRSLLCLLKCAGRLEKQTNRLLTSANRRVDMEEVVGTCQ